MKDYLKIARIFVTTLVLFVFIFISCAVAQENTNKILQKIGNVITSTEMQSILENNNDILRLNLEKDYTSLTDEEKHFIYEELKDKSFKSIDELKDLFNEKIADSMTDTTVVTEDIIEDDEDPIYHDSSILLVDKIAGGKDRESREKIHGIYDTEDRYFFINPDDFKIPVFRRGVTNNEKHIEKNTDEKFSDNNDLEDSKYELEELDKIDDMDLKNELDKENCYTDKDIKIILPTPAPTPPRTRSAGMIVRESTTVIEPHISTDVSKQVLFNDINNHWAKDDIETMVLKGIVEGVDKYTFKPDVNITRAEVTALIVRALGLKPISYIVQFKDVLSGSWYESSITTAVQADIIAGYNDYFRPDDTVTREEVAKIISKSFKYEINNNDIIPKANVTRADAVTIICRLLDYR